MYGNRTMGSWCISTKQSNGIHSSTVCRYLSEKMVPYWDHDSGCGMLSWCRESRSVSCEQGMPSIIAACLVALLLVLCIPWLCHRDVQGIRWIPDECHAWPAKSVDWLSCYLDDIIGHVVTSGRVVSLIIQLLCWWLGACTAVNHNWLFCMLLSRLLVGMYAGSNIVEA